MRCQSCQHEWRGNYGEGCPSCGAVALNPFESAAGGFGGPPEQPPPPQAPAAPSAPTAPEPNPWDRRVTFSEEAMPADGEGIPWENEQTVSSAFETIKRALFSPTETFADAAPDLSVGPGLVFFLIFGGLGFMALAAFQVATLALSDDPSGMGASEFIIMIAVMPISMAVWGLVLAGLSHLGLMIVGGAEAGFATTLRAYCFATGASGALYFVPICGAMVAGIWGLVILVIAVREMHDITTGKALFAIFFPFILCCGGAGMIGVIAGAAGA